MYLHRDIDVTTASSVESESWPSIPEIAKAGRKVYERHRADLERRQPGKYVLIDIRTEKVFLAESPEAAFRKAAAEHIEGPFHLVRVGERAAFRSRRLPHADATRLAR